MVPEFHYWLNPYLLRACQALHDLVIIYPSQISSSTTWPFPKAPLAFPPTWQANSHLWWCTSPSLRPVQGCFLTSFRYPQIHPASEQVTLTSLSILPPSANLHPHFVFLHCISTNWNFSAGEQSFYCQGHPLAWKFHVVNNSGYYPVHDSGQSQYLINDTK